MKFKIIRLKKVKSTNDSAIRILRNSKQNYGMIIAETQSKGRGQYGRKWLSFRGNLFVSFFYSLEKINSTTSQLTKINCLLVKKLITKYYKKKILYKKPNDLLIEGKKICGILQETVNIMNKRFLIVGIGINLIKKPIISNYPTISLNDLINKKISKKRIEIELKNIFETKFDKLINK